MKKYISTATFGLILSGSLSGCLLSSSDKDKQVNYETDLSSTKNGCVQGSLVDGTTGQPMSVPASSGKNGVYVLVRNIPMPAAQIGSTLGEPNGQKSEADGTLFESEYLICNVPLDEKFPIFAYKEGYVPFEGAVFIHSSLNPNSEKNVIQKSAPTFFANIRLFPVGSETRDLQFYVTSDGRPVSGATITLSAPQGSFVAQTDPDSFLIPLRFRGGSLIAKTGTDGLVTFSAKQLALGMSYNYLVTPPKTELPLTASTGNLTVGLYAGSPGLSRSSYYIPVELDSTLPALTLLSSSIQTQRVDISGALTLVFNRPVEFVPGTLDLLTATLNNNLSKTCLLPPNVANNDNSEQISVSISNHLVTLTPIFAVLPLSSPSPEDRKMSISYNLNNVFVRPAGDTGTAAKVSLGTLMSAVGDVPMVMFYQ